MGGRQRLGVAVAVLGWLLASAGIIALGVDVYDPVGAAAVLLGAALLGLSCRI